MIGTNELNLNEATMIQAMQEWLDKRMGCFSPKVVSVLGGTKEYNTRTFTVATTDRDPEGKNEGTK